MPHQTRVRSNINYYIPIDNEADCEFDDAKRFEILENTIAKKTKFPIFMAIPYLTVALAIISVIALPASSGLTIAGFTHLSMIFYGIVNDMLATRDSVEYFRFGHQPGQMQRVCIPSTNKNAQAFHWGILATWVLSFIGSGIIGLTAALVPVSPIIFPIITIGLISSLIGAQLWSRTQDKNSNIDNFFIPSLPFADIKPSKWWKRCNARNSFGYKVLPLLGITLTVGIATGAINALGGIATLAVLVSNPIMPIILAAPMILLVGAMAINFMIHRNTIELEQTLPRKFGTNPNFAFENEKLEPNNDPSTQPKLQLDQANPVQQELRLIAAVTPLRDCQEMRDKEANTTVEENPNIRPLSRKNSNTLM